MKTKILVEATSEEKLFEKEDWKNGKVVSLGDVKRMLKAFKELGIKNDLTTLIFSDGETFFRKAGEQHKFYCFFSKKMVDDFCNREKAFYRVVKKGGDEE